MSSREVIGRLQRDGWRLVRTKGSHHQFKHPDRPGLVTVPRPGRIEAHRRNPEFADGTWAVVAVDAATLRARAKRINITLPERLLDAVDDFARRSGETRSGLLAKAATQYVGRARERHLPSRRRVRRRHRRTAIR